jgi:hypothetical protein
MGERWRTIAVNESAGYCGRGGVAPSPIQEAIAASSEIRGGVI